jgi:hypothetical protein
VIGASVFDAQSSWGRQELNPALRGPNGEFGARGVAMKAAIAGGVVTAQYFLLRKHSGAAKYAAITNFGMASLLTRTALPPPAPVPQPRPAYLVAGPVSAETGGGQ